MILDPVSSFEALKSINWFTFFIFRGILQGISRGSSHVYPTLGLYQVSALSLREGVRDILAQCNRPKPIPTCTSSLGFSRIYILMLGLIVTHVIVLQSYIIKM